MKHYMKKKKTYSFIKLGMGVAICLSGIFLVKEVKANGGFTKEDQDIIKEMTKIEEAIKTEEPIKIEKPIEIEESIEEDWKLTLVNPWNKLPDDYEIEIAKLENGHGIDKRAYEDLQDMLDDARKEGLSPLICSSYRTMEKQQSLFKNKINYYINQGYNEEEATEKASQWVAIPGTSEHQLGLALDIVSKDYQLLNEQQENTKEQKWLMENSYKYGFVLRYPKDKTHITGINYEPWHYRYVGKEVAAEMMEENLVLEEYLELMK